jgi:carbonic anhydrase/acetyltransferase-like protein (isoleucine patch superfamily)
MLYEINGKRPQLDEESFVAPSAQLIGDVIIKRKASVWFNAVLRGDIARIVIDEESNFQDGSVAHGDAGFDTVIGRHVTIGHNTVIHGCTIGDGSLIGMGATVLTGAKIGKECLIAAGALVGENMIIPDHSVVMGVPARIVKEVSPAMLERLYYSGQHYLDILPDYLSLREIK